MGALASCEKSQYEYRAQGQCSAYDAGEPDEGGGTAQVGDEAEVHTEVSGHEAEGPKDCGHDSEPVDDFALSLGINNDVGLHRAATLTRGIQKATRRGRGPLRAIFGSFSFIPGRCEVAEQRDEVSTVGSEGSQDWRESLANFVDVLEVVGHRFARQHSGLEFVELVVQTRNYRLEGGDEGVEHPEEHERAGHRCPCHEGARNGGARRAGWGGRGRTP